MPSKMIVIYKVKAEDMEKIDQMEADLKTVSVADFKDSKKEELGFGIQILKVAYLIDEKNPGQLEELTKTLNELASVGEAEVETMTLL